MLKLSASSIGCYDKCPKQYHYRYIVKPDIEAKDWSFLEFGKCAHEALENFHKYLMDNVVDPEKYKYLMRDSLKAAIKNYNFAILKPDFPELKQVLQNYLDMIKREGLPPVVDVERNFKFVLDGHLLRGFIDRTDLISPGYYHIVDYKTNKNPKYLKPFQLLLYGLALNELYPDVERIRGSYCLLKHNSRMKTWEFSAQDLQDTREQIRKVGTDITLGASWEKKPTILCNWCDYQSICQKPSLELDTAGQNWVGDDIFE